MHSHTIAKGTLQRLKVQVDEALGELGTFSSDSKLKLHSHGKKKGKGGNYHESGDETRGRTPSVDCGLPGERGNMALNVVGAASESSDHFPPALSVRRSSFQSDNFATLTSRGVSSAFKAGVSNPTIARNDIPMSVSPTPLSLSPPSQSTPFLSPVNGGVISITVTSSVVGGGGVGLSIPGSRSGAVGMGARTVGTGIPVGVVGGFEGRSSERGGFEVSSFSLSMDIFGCTESFSSSFLATPAFHALRPPVRNLFVF
jgi:hypothetical protein